MSDSPCYQLAKSLKATIDARVQGKQVQSVGHKSRQLEYAETPLKDLIAYYNQVRLACPEAMSDPALIAIAPLDQPTAKRGRPVRFYGRSHV